MDTITHGRPGRKPEPALPESARQALLRAIAASGGQVRLAAALGIRQPSVSDWVQRGRVSRDRAPALARISGVPLAELRPDLVEGE